MWNLPWAHPFVIARITILRRAKLLFLFFFFFGESHFSKQSAFSVGLVHCLWELQTSSFNKTLIENESRGTIHTFKNYFATVFSVFNF